MYKPYTTSYAFWSQTMYNYMNGIYPTWDTKNDHINESQCNKYDMLYYRIYF